MFYHFCSALILKFVTLDFRAYIVVRSRKHIEIYIRNKDDVQEIALNEIYKILKQIDDLDLVGIEFTFKELPLWRGWFRKISLTYDYDSLGVDNYDYFIWDKIFFASLVTLIGLLSYLRIK